MEKEDKNKRKSLPNKKHHQLGWQEGTRAAVASIHVKENQGTVVGAKGENLHHSKCHSLGTLDNAVCAFL